MTLGASRDSGTRGIPGSSHSEEAFSQLLGGGAVRARQSLGVDIEGHPDGGVTEARLSSLHVEPRATISDADVRRRSWNDTRSSPAFRTAGTQTRCRQFE